MSIRAADLADLKARHLAFLEARLVSEQAEAEWRENAAAVLAALLGARVGAVVHPALLADALDAALTPDAVAQAARPVGGRVLPLVLRELRAEPGKLKDRVPAAARARLEALIARPSAFPDRLMREL